MLSYLKVVGTLVHLCKTLQRNENKTQKATSQSADIYSSRPNVSTPYQKSCIVCNVYTFCYFKVSIFSCRLSSEFSTRLHEVMGFSYSQSHMNRKVDSAWPFTIKLSTCFKKWNDSLDDSSYVIVLIFNQDDPFITH